MGIEKYSYETKLEVVKYAIENRCTVPKTSEIFCIPTTPIERWLRSYQIHGEKGLISRKSFRSKSSGFSGQFKLNVLKYMYDNELSYSKTAAYFCVDVATVSKWNRIYLEKGEKILLSTNGMQTKPMTKPKKPLKNEQEIQALIYENQKLKMENDYLKKLNALVRKKEKSATKKKPL